MKYTSVDQYANHIHESIALTILKRLFANKIRPALNQATNIIMDDPELEDAMERMQKINADIEKRLDIICIMAPNHHMCKDRKNTRK